MEERYRCIVVLVLVSLYRIHVKAIKASILKTCLFWTMASSFVATACLTQSDCDDTHYSTCPVHVKYTGPVVYMSDAYSEKYSRHSLSYTCCGS